MRAQSRLPYTIGVGHQVNPGGIHHLHILFSRCEAELEELIVHESEQRRTRRQVLILSPLQNQRGRRCNNATFTSSCFGKPIPQQIKLCEHLVSHRAVSANQYKSSCASIWFDIELFRQTNTSTNQAVPASGSRFLSRGGTRLASGHQPV